MPNNTPRLPTETAELLAIMQARYPQHEFGVSHKQDCACDDAPWAPDWLVVFTHEDETIVDPLTLGFGPCDPQTVYGIRRADAQRIRVHNQVVAGRSSAPHAHALLCACSAILPGRSDGPINGIR